MIDQSKAMRHAGIPLQQCKICGSETVVVFNIKLAATPICESCARAITGQQIDWMLEQ